MGSIRLVGVRAAIAGLVLLLTAVSGHAEDVLLRFKFAPQQEITYDAWVTGVAEMSLSGIPLPAAGARIPSPMRINGNGRLSLLVKAVDDEGNGTLGARLEAMRLQMQTPDDSVHIVMDLAKGTVEVNGETRQMPGQPMQQMMGLLENLAFTISPRGRYLDISGLPEMPLPGTSGIQMPAFGQMLDFEKIVKSAPAMYPQGAVAVGDSWEATMALPLPSMEPEQHPQYTIRYTLERLGEIDGHRIACLGFQAAVEGAKLALPMPGALGGAESEDAAAAAMAPRMDLSFVETGQMFFDLDEGQVRSARADLTENIRLELNLPQGTEQSSPGSMGMEMNLQMHFVLSSG